MHDTDEIISKIKTKGERKTETVWEIIEKETSRGETCKQSGREW